MPYQETAFRKQYAVLWASDADGNYDDYGNPKLADAVQIKVRWEDRQGEALNPQGQTVRFDAVVHVAQTITIGSEFWKGKLIDYEALTTAPQRYACISYDEVPDLKNRIEYREVKLMRKSAREPILL